MDVDDRMSEKDHLEDEMTVRCRSSAENLRVKIASCHECSRMRGAAAFSPRKFIALFFSCDDITCSPSVINAREHCNLRGCLHNKFSISTKTTHYQSIFCNAHCN
jgi:hypothetical protein